MGLEKISLQYEGIGITLLPEMSGREPLYRVPMTLHFPSGHNEKTRIGFDREQQVFIHQLVEDRLMQEHFPEELPSSEADKGAWRDKWNDYRVEASEIFATLGKLGYVQIQEADRF